MAVVDIDTEREQKRKAALLRAIGLDKVPPEQREIALAIATRYELDLLLKHLVLVDGRPYITRDGLLHVGHRSGVLDGIEVTDPELVELTGLGQFWHARCSVYRKDMSRPFTYAGRYPAKGGSNARFAPEMAVKVAEVMALRRAFDVSAPVIEERWDIETQAPDEPIAPITEVIAAKRRTISGPRADRQEPGLPVSAPAVGQGEEAGTPPLPVEPDEASGAESRRVLGGSGEPPRSDTRSAPTSSAGARTVISESAPSSTEASLVTSAQADYVMTPMPASDASERCLTFHSEHGRCVNDTGHEGPHTDQQGETWTSILGPCRCQGCNEEVVYVRCGRVTGWLHENGVLRCLAPIIDPSLYADQRSYNREWMRRSRAAA